MSSGQMTNLFFVGTNFFLASCGSSNQQQMQGPPPVATITVQTVSASDAVYHDEYPATVIAFNQTDLRAQVSGFITGIFFRDGDRVRKGQRLYTLDQQQFEAN